MRSDQRTFSSHPVEEITRLYRLAYNEQFAIYSKMRTALYAIAIAAVNEDRLSRYASCMTRWYVSFVEPRVVHQSSVNSANGFWSQGCYVFGDRAQ